MLWSEGCDLVQCGSWINWNHGAVQGASLTLPNQWALILSGFLALFVKLVGGYLWETICFVIHQTKASLDKHDDIHHQIQLVLRNSEHESNFVWKLIKIGLAHKEARFDASRRSALLALLAITHSLGIWAAGGLSSRFIAGSDEVQVLSTTCGWMREYRVDNISDATWDSTNALLVMARYRYKKSASYARSCYGQVGGTPAACGIFREISLPYTINTTTPCPFDEKICNGSAISIDTGFLRSDLHLGINTRPEDSISFRKQLTCVPLAGQKYTDGWKNRTDSNGETISPYIGYEFGPRVTKLDRSLGNYTFGITDTYFSFANQPYSLTWVTAFLNYQGDQSRVFNFNPIPELQSTDSDVSVVSLFNPIGYRAAVADPWFNAEYCTSDTNSNNIGYSDLVDRCITSQPLSFLGCQERYQFCLYGNERCTPFTGLYGISAAPEGSPGLNPSQLAVFQLYWKIAWATQLHFQLGFIGRENLVALDYLWDGGFAYERSATLPPDHWHREVLNWMNTTLSVAQSSTLDFARVPEFDRGPEISALKYVVPPAEPAAQLLCHRMKARSKQHTSFSVLGLSILIALGLLLITLSLILPNTVAYLQTRTGKGLHKRLEWIESSSFQLQRMAAEGRGIGPWEGRDQDVPRLWGGKWFSLTKGSLQGRWARVGEYGVVMQEDEIELVNGRYEGLG